MLNNGKYDALTVARYIVNYCYTNNFSCSNLKLQKLLYFVQAQFLVNTNSGIPCFDDVIEAWELGPVVPSVYHEFKKFGSWNIPFIDTYYKFNGIINDTVECVFSDESILTEDKENIIQVINTFKNYSACDLVDLTHNQDPWINAYRPHMNNPITIESIRDYFNEQ